MASYTMELREYIEKFSQYEEGLTRNQIIEVGRPKLFSFDYPIFDEDYRSVLETHFIRTFYMREIGFETEELFKFYLETWLIINMPYYNKLFESELIVFDPLKNSEMDIKRDTKKDVVQSEDGSRNVEDTESGKAKSIGSSDSQSETTYSDTSSGTKNVETDRLNDNFERVLDSDTPQNRLAITTEDGKGIIEYASKINEKIGDSQESQSQDTTESKTSGGNSQTTGTGNTEVNDESNLDRERKEHQTLDRNVNELEDYIEHRSGKIGVQSYSKLLSDFRNSFLRIERQMFDEMSELFMLIY